MNEAFDKKDIRGLDEVTFFAARQYVKRDVHTPYYFWWLPKNKPLCMRHTCLT